MSQTSPEFETPADEEALANFMYSIRCFLEAEMKAKMLWPRFAAAAALVDIVTECAVLGKQSSETVVEFINRIAATKAAGVAQTARDPAVDPIELRANVLEVCANICKTFREKHGSPVGDAYSNGVWDQGVRVEQAIRALAALSDTSTDRPDFKDTLVNAREAIVLAIAFLGRDSGSDRLQGTIRGLLERLGKADAEIRAALAVTSPQGNSK